MTPQASPPAATLVAKVRAQAQRLALFPTPAFTARLPGATALNTDLKAVILAREAATPQGLTNSNLGGWHSGRDLAQWGGAPVRAVIEATVAFANQVTRDRQGRAAEITWSVECWANVNRRGNANKRHSHPGCLWSATYYVAAGYVEAGQGDARGPGQDGTDPTGADQAGGAFVLHDPRGVAPLLGAALGGDRLVQPADGLLVLFPAWMPHSVQPYRGAGTRISIALNLALNPAGGGAKR